MSTAPRVLSALQLRVVEQIAGVRSLPYTGLIGATVRQVVDVFLLDINAPIFGLVPSVDRVKNPAPALLRILSANGSADARRWTYSVTPGCEAELVAALERAGACPVAVAALKTAFVMRALGNP